MQTTTGIKAILFDFWGVLMRLESTEPQERLAASMGRTRMEISAAVFRSKEHDLVELGLISVEERWRRTAEILKLSEAEMFEFCRQFFSHYMLDPHLADYIGQLRPHYTTAVLSNATVRIAEIIEKDWGIGSAFDRLFISAHLGMMKPAPGIYYRALDELGLAPHEVVFIDDAPRNVEAGRAVGMNVIRFTTVPALLDELQALLGDIPPYRPDPARDNCRWPLPILS